ncbi:MAG TPA: protein kinase [Gemmatimonadales bacterium]
MTNTRTVCEHCGALVEAAALYCPACGSGRSAPGARLSDTTAPPRPPPASPGRTGTRPAPPETQGTWARLLEQLRDATLGEYEILVELGSGGMATVFLAHDLQLDRRVAIKVMHPSLLIGEDMVERFLLEARTAAGLSHPNIIPIYAVRVQENLLFFVMKFVEGRPLDSIIRKEAPLPPDMVRQIVSQMADALGYAHRHGVIHRDVKPANILISTEGHPVLTDFGIAKVADKHGLTMTGATIGTPTYMSPEQCHAIPLTGASDQYSLGVMAYEMLTGKPPFDADYAMTVMYKHINESPRPIRETVPDCPPDLSATIERMLAKSPEDRFPEIQEVARTIHAPAVASENAVRTRLIQLAKTGPHRDVLQRVSTPRSPLPMTTAGRARSRMGKVGATSETVPAAQPTHAARSLPLAVLGGVVAVAVGAGLLAVWKPWTRGEPGIAPGSEVERPQPPVVDPVTSGQRPEDSVAAEPVIPAPRPSPPPAERGVNRPPVSPPAPPARVSAVRVLGLSNLGLGENTALRAEARDAQGRLLAGHPVVWTSSAPGIVSVTGAGELLARDTGRAVITASIDGATDSLVVTVAPETIARVSVSPATLTLDPGGSATLTPRVVGASGRSLEPRVEWSSSAPAVAAVSSGGTVTARSPGSAVITAASGGEAASATVTVREAGPTEAELRGQVATVIQAYAAALQSKDVSRVRELYPGMTAERERQLRQALLGMQDLQVRLTLGQVQFGSEAATAQVTGSWVFTANGRRSMLPADNTYRLERRGAEWVITDIR